MHVRNTDTPTTLPFFHPTSVVVVDDDPDFLQSFDFLVGDEIACRLYSNPQEAVAHLKDDATTALPGAPFFFPCASAEGYRRFFEPTDRFIAFTSSKIRDLMFNDRRFDMPSVVVVDFDMPDINGVEFCRRIKDLPCKKVILTGKADEKVAVQAFNEGLIDRFICKHSETVSEEIFATLHQLQWAYFKDLTAPMVEALRVKPPEFVDDPGFATYFQSLCEREGVIEYYFSANPQGVLMLDADGGMKFLLVRGDRDLRAHCEIVEDYEGPQELQERLMSGQEQPWFPTHHGYYEPEITNWQDYIYPVERIAGRDDWSCSLIGGVETFFDPDGRLQSFSLFRGGVHAPTLQ